MPVKVELYRDGRATLTTFSEPLDMREVAEAMEKSNKEILDQASKPVHGIIDATHLTRLPSHLLGDSANVAKTKHPNSGKLIVVSKNSFITTVANILSKVLSDSLPVYKSLDEAWAEIDRILAEEEKTS